MAASFLSDHGNELTAIATVVLAFVVARLADRGIAKRMAKVDQLSPVAITRLRLVRRLIFALIILIGLALALA